MNIKIIAIATMVLLNACELEPLTSKESASVLIRDDVVDLCVPKEKYKLKCTEIFSSSRVQAQLCTSDPLSSVNYSNLVGMEKNNGEIVAPLQQYFDEQAGMLDARNHRFLVGMMYWSQIAFPNVNFDGFNLSKDGFYYGIIITAEDYGRGLLNNECERN